MTVFICLETARTQGSPSPGISGAWVGQGQPLGHGPPCAQHRPLENFGAGRCSAIIFSAAWKSPPQTDLWRQLGQTYLKSFGAGISELSLTRGRLQQIGLRVSHTSSNSSTRVVRLRGCGHITSLTRALVPHLWNSGSNENQAYWSIVRIRRVNSTKHLAWLMAQGKQTIIVGSYYFYD